MSLLFANETLKQAMHIAQALAKENYNESYGAPHLLQALMHKEIGLQDYEYGAGFENAAFGSIVDENNAIILNHYQNSFTNLKWIIRHDKIINDTNKY